MFSFDSKVGQQTRSCIRRLKDSPRFIPKFNYNAYTLPKFSGKCHVPQNSTSVRLIPPLVPTPSSFVWLTLKGEMLSLTVSVQKDAFCRISACSLLFSFLSPSVIEFVVPEFRWPVKRALFRLTDMKAPQRLRILCAGRSNWINLFGKVGFDWGFWSIAVLVENWKYETKNCL